MTDRRTKELIAAAFVAECGEDFVGVWAILWEIKRAFPRYDAIEARRVSIEVVRLMLDSDKMIIGDFGSEKQFVRWPLPDDEALQRLEAAWDTLGREPDIGDLAWLVVDAVGPDPGCARQESLAVKEDEQ